MKTIDTLVEDIQNLLINEDVEFTDESIKGLGEALALSIASSLRTKKSDKGGLRFSNVGMPCERKLYYTVNSPEDAEPMTPELKMKFLYGHILEEILLWLASEAGHEVTGRQDEMEVAGVTGHRDAIIDGVLVDAKSASSRSFQKFKANGLREDDPFGYLTQINLYFDKSKDLITDHSRVAFLVIDKQLGHICLDVYEPDENYQAEELILEKQRMVSDPQPPARGYVPVPDGKSGNMKLDTACSYCDYKFKCWPSLKTYIYSNGPRFLTKVVREPKVSEASDDNTRHSF